jgi:hypothetical protein
MKTKNKVWARAVLMLCALFFTVACDNGEPMGKGEADFEITDAPIDDASVEGVFVTVTDVRVNGTSIAGFSGKQTINLMAYQEGATKLLGSAELDARSYSNLTLVLDLDEDANGNEPGCYVLSASNAKHKLASTTSGTLEIALNKSWSVKENVKSRIVMDFDLRKTIRYTGEETPKYSFVGSGELNSGIRIINNASCATIAGNFDGEFNNDTEKVAVYAYKKGTYAASEAQADAGGVAFKNAVSSTLVKTEVLANTYTLAYVEEGEYNLIFVKFAKNQSTGQFAFSSVLNTETSINGTVNNVIKVNAGVDLNVTASLNF